MRVAARALSVMGGSRRMISKLPLAGGWTDHREMPAPSGKTFRELYRERKIS
jgi:L-lactate dehydrogenase complex protein LldF